jgi:lactoylglutathione lyase
MQATVTSAESLRLGYTIVYVQDVEASLGFFERAFGFARRFVAPGAAYGELETGVTTLGFAQHETARGLLHADYVAADASAKPLGMEVAFVTSDVPAALKRALDAGAVLVHDTATQPWGQTTAYLRTPDGTLVELCTPMG